MRGPPRFEPRGQLGSVGVVDCFEFGNFCDCLQELNCFWFLAVISSTPVESRLSANIALNFTEEKGIDAY